MFQSDKKVMSTKETGTIRHGQGGQLTIFYEGTMNVYDNVPIDKAQAIMLLAGESSMYDPPKRRPTTTTGGLAARQLPSISELEADLPIARKHSLQCFFERRRDRVKNKGG
ncbi:protein TIFY 3-like [Aristolochia californica]|uniref:protein TIFY 3-like n=1 Tax=Aristolochia californica TaxID=171875 RepID=UPI0035D66324